MLIKRNRPVLDSDIASARLLMASYSTMTPYFRPERVVSMRLTSACGGGISRFRAGFGEMAADGFEAAHMLLCKLCGGLFAVAL